MIGAVGDEHVATRIAGRSPPSRGLLYNFGQTLGAREVTSGRHAAETLQEGQFVRRCRRLVGGTVGRKREMHLCQDDFFVVRIESCEDSAGHLDGGGVLHDVDDAAFVELGAHDVAGDGGCDAVVLLRHFDDEGDVTVGELHTA